MACSQPSTPWTNEPRSTYPAPLVPPPQLPRCVHCSGVGLQEEGGRLVLALYCIFGFGILGFGFGVCDVQAPGVWELMSAKRRFLGVTVGGQPIQAEKAVTANRRQQAHRAATVSDRTQALKLRDTSRFRVEG